jgi:Anaphase-promoting complex subunit 5
MPALMTALMSFPWSACSDAPDAAAARAQALLALSELHAEYGHSAHALEALMEAVDVDQGAGDGESLVTCLSQLCAVLRAVPPAAGSHGGSPSAMMQARPAGALLQTWRAI